jgi:HAD superfamily hydrolase (TIGR01549 family)
MIDTVVFDFVNTLAYLKPKRENVIYNFLLNNGTEISKSKIANALKVADDKCHYSCFEIVDKESKKNFFKTKYNKALLVALEVDYTTANCLALYEYFDSTHKEWILHDGAMEIIKQLKDLGYTVGVASNFDKTLKENLAAKLNLIDNLDFLEVSQCIGLEKPDIKFYEYVIKNNNLNPQNTLYIGDSYVLDYLPGQEVGFNCCLYDKNNIHMSVSNKITHFNQVLEYINK